MEGILKHMRRPTKKINSATTVTKKAIRLLIVKTTTRKVTKNNEKSNSIKKSKCSIENLSKEMKKYKKTFTTLQDKTSELKEDEY